MKIKNKKDLGLGAFCIVFAAIIAYLSMQLKATGYEGDPGPKMFPLIGSVIMAVCGIALIIAPEKEAKVFLTKEQWKAAFGLFGMYVGFALMFWLFGFIIAEDGWEWDADTRTSTITKISKVFDVSAVSIPANGGTEIHARSYLDGVIEAEHQELVLRDRDRRRRAAAALELKH